MANFDPTDWSLVQSFLAVAETGSLSAAAAQLGHSQPTLGRHIRALEDSLGTELFQRHPRGLKLTKLGTSMLPHAQAMRAAIHQMSLQAEAQSGTLSGTVRIACSVFAAHHILPPVVARIRRALPEVSIVLQPSDDSDNLLFREADIAVRMYRPRQLDLITKHILDIEIGVFAAHSYLEGRSVPRTLADLQNHDVVGYDQSTLMTDAMAAMGTPITRQDFAIRTDNQSAYWELVRAGCGIGFTQAHLGRDDPLVQELKLDFAVPNLPIWLTAQDNVRRIPRVDRVWDVLAAGIPEVVGRASNR